MAVGLPTFVALGNQYFPLLVYAHTSIQIEITSQIFFLHIWQQYIAQPSYVYVYLYITKYECRYTIKKTAVIVMKLNKIHQDLYHNPDQNIEDNCTFLVKF